MDIYAIIDQSGQVQAMYEYEDLDIVERFPLWTGVWVEGTEEQLNDEPAWYDVIDGELVYNAARKQQQDDEMAEAEKTRQYLLNVVDASAISFVVMAQAEMFDDITITEHADIFSPWVVDIEYKAKDIVHHTDGKLYRCIQAHTSQPSWPPDKTLSIWTPIGDPTEEWPDWSQPLGAHDAYDLGMKVSFNDKHWISTINGNIWQPGVYGWDEVK